MKKPKPKKPALKQPPGVIQLPGGYTLQGVPFEIVERDADGRPTLFKLLPPGASFIGVNRCAFYADELQVRSTTFAK